MLVVLDGWGVSAPSPGNAISKANIPNMNSFLASYPHTQLSASGESVGLPHGEVGNTETGHLNLGAGRIVYQDLQKINMSIADGTFYNNQTLLEAIAHAKINNSNLHLMGLIGAGGVHSNIEHMFALIGLAKKQEFTRVFLHLFLDGRDSPPTASKSYVSQIREAITREGIGQIASLMGRYWAMDRDLRWDRTAKAYFALTRGEGHLVKTPEEAIDGSYAEGKTDEFIEPALISDSNGKPLATINDNDSVIFFNFRIDRPRQLARAFVYEDLNKANESSGFDPYLIKYQKTHLAQAHSPTPIFDRGAKLKNLCFVTMTEYGKPIVEAGAKVAFPPEVVKIPLGRVISEAGYKQLRACESEKERFVTFYFNGMLESGFEGEDKIIVPSPKVATYDLKPEMSAREVTESVLGRLREQTGDYKFVLINFANADMVGHTGNIGSTAKACEVLDECLGKLSSFILAYGGTMLVTADHGNAEDMIDAGTGETETEHSANPVPFIAISKELAGRSQALTSGILADVAPTILKLLDLQVPDSMTGRNLLEPFTNS